MRLFKQIPYAVTVLFSVFGERFRNAQTVELFTVGSVGKEKEKKCGCCVKLIYSVGITYFAIFLRMYSASWKRPCVSNQRGLSGKIHQNVKTLINGRVVTKASVLQSLTAQTTKDNETSAKEYAIFTKIVTVVLCFGPTSSTAKSMF